MEMRKRISKRIAVMLVMVMVLTNPIFIGPLYAANAENNGSSHKTELLEMDSQKEHLDATAVPNEGIDKVQGSMSFKQFLNDMIPFYLKGGQRNGPEWLKTTDFQFSFADDYRPQYSLTTVQPFGQATNKGQLWFWQGRYAYQSNNNTANVGIGWRTLSPDKQQMYGLNMFYDYGFQYNLSRIGLGAEYFNKLAEYRVNLYLPTSGDRLTDVSYQPDGILYSYIRAVRGLDYEAGTSFKHARWLSLYASGYFYDDKYQPNEVGFKLRSVMQLTPRFAVEAGYNRSNLGGSGFFGDFKYQLGGGLGPSLSDGNKRHDEKPIDLTYKLLQKVERDNTIKTETFTKFVAYSGSIQVSVTNSSSTGIQGAMVQAYQNGSPVGNAVMTNSAGVALLTGLSVGSYTVKADYFTYSGNSGAVTVSKDQTTATAVSLPVTGGGATVQILNSQNQAVGGASVTASQVLVAQAQRSILDRVLGVQAAYAASSPFSVTVTANTNGVATFTNLPPGTYTFTVRSNNEVMNGPTVAVTGGGTATATVILPDSGGNINATIKDRNGSALSGANVALYSKDDPGTVLKNETTGSDGTAIFPGLPGGAYVLWASMSGYASNSDNVTVTSGNTANGSIELTAAQQTGSVSVSLSGTMSVSNYTVTVTDSNNVTHTATVNSTSKTATIVNVPVGSCAVAVTPPSGYTATASPTSFTLTTSGQAVGVTSAQQTGSVNITLSGTMSASDYTVTVTDSNNVTHTATVNSTSTTATIANVPVGSCTVAVTPPGGYVGTPSPGSFTLGTGGQAVTVTSSQQYGDVAFSLQGNIDTSGADYTVTLTDSLGTQHTAVLNNTTTSATISHVPVGSTTVTVSLPNTSGYTGIPSPSTFTLDASGKTVDVNSSYMTSSVVFNLTGTIAPTGDYTVTLTDGLNVTHTTTVNSANQTATISGVAVGTCHVSVTSPTGYTVNISPSIFGLWTSGQTVSISSGTAGGTNLVVTISISAVAMSDAISTIGSNVYVAAYDEPGNMVGPLVLVTKNGDGTGSATVTIPVTDLSGIVNPVNFYLSNQAVSIYGNYISPNYTFSGAGTLSATIP
jgi:hypothetical protein